MKKRYYSNFSYGSNDVLKWRLFRDSIDRQSVCKGKGIYENNLLVKGFRGCNTNLERFEFINLLIDEERELLVSRINDQEFCCFISIIKRIEDLDEGFSVKKKSYNKIIFESEIILNNMVQRIKFVREVHCDGY